MTDDQRPILGQPPVTTEQVEELVVDAAPVVAYPDKPWVMVAGAVGAIALGGIVLGTLLSGQKAREVGGIVPTRVATNDTGLGAPVPPAPELFAAVPPDPLAAGNATPPPTPAVTPPSEGQASWQGSPPPPSPPPPPPPPPPLPPIIEYRDRPYPPSPTPGPNLNPSPVVPVPPQTVRPAADLAQRMRSPALIIDLSQPTVPAAEANATATPSGGGDNDAFAARLAASETSTARAGALRNPKFVVPQGAMISAVLETAINSDLPGFVRAIVSRDVTSFDGSRVLIPRGSRLVGQYKSEVALGQSRAFVIWTRLMRPDGVSVQLASPGTDTLGRAGLSGRVNRHFVQRYGPGLLTTAITSALGRNTSNQLVIGTAQTAAAATTGESIKPTVTVAQGTAIQVFVSRDLDFSNPTRPIGSTTP
jgi:type IV secretory pathway VirB10-like protein